MKLTRRTLSIAISSLFAAATLPAFAQAKAIQEGIDYIQLKPRQPVLAAANKIEITEFFWYGCPHCNVLESPLTDWLKKQGADIEFRRVHIDFGPRTESHQRLFYALEQMGELQKHHVAVFTAIHGDKKSLANKDQVTDWVKSRGIDAAKFEAAYTSFGLSTKLNQAKQLQNDYKVDGVPYLAIDGQYITSPSIAGGSMANFFTVMDAVVAKVRSTRTPAAANPAPKAVKK